MDWFKKQKNNSEMCTNAVCVAGKLYGQGDMLQSPWPYIVTNIPAQK